MHLRQEPGEGTLRGKIILLGLLCLSQYYGYDLVFQPHRRERFHRSKSMNASKDPEQSLSSDGLYRIASKYSTSRTEKVYSDDQLIDEIDFGLDFKADDVVVFFQYYKWCPYYKKYLADLEKFTRDGIKFTHILKIDW